jgi:hypothetical protein
MRSRRNEKCLGGATKKAIVAITTINQHSDPHFFANLITRLMDGGADPGAQMGIDNVRAHRPHSRL